MQPRNHAVVPVPNNGPRTVQCRKVDAKLLAPSSRCKTVEVGANGLFVLDITATVDVSDAPILVTKQDDDDGSCKFESYHWN